MISQLGKSLKSYHHQTTNHQGLDRCDPGSKGKGAALTLEEQPPPSLLFCYLRVEPDRRRDKKTKPIVIVNPIRECSNCYENTHIYAMKTQRPLLACLTGTKVYSV